MNELQIKLTADIASFKAAMATVEQKLKNAETILEKASGEADKYRGALASLSAEYKRGAISQEQYDKQVTKLSNDLLKQQDIINNSTLEVNRLSKEYNKLGSSSLIANQNKLSQSTNNLGNSVNGLTKNIANGNGVALEFNRIIQDSPFGIIGIGNNIQQLAGNFSQLSKSAGGTGAAIKASFAALATGPNLALLAISALTAGFTAYQMGAFSAKDKTKELVDEIDRLKEASDNYLKTLSAVNLSRVRGEQSAQSEIVTLDRLFKATTDTTLSLDQRKKAIDELQRLYPNVFGNIRDEIILNGDAKESYELLTEAILANARAKAAESTLIKNEETLIALQTEREELNQKIAKSEELIDLRKKDQVVTVGQLKSLGQQIADSETRLLEPSLKRRAEISKEINKLTKDNLELTNKVRENFQTVGSLLDTVPTKVDAVTNSVTKLNRTFEEEGNFIDQFLERNALERLDTFASSYENVFMRVESGKGIIVSANQAIDSNLSALSEQTTEYTNTILGAFTDLGVGIVSSLDISNNSLRGFLTTLVSATPKIIAAVMAQARASNAAAALANKGNAQQATGNAIVTATSAAKGLGPIGLALLPVFIAGAVALVSGAFRKSGSGGGGGGGGSASAGVGSTFTNAKPPNVGGFASPSRSGVDISNVSSGFGSMQLDIKLQGVVSGTDLVFIYDEAVIKRGNR